MDNITQGVIGGSIYTLIAKKPTNKAIWLGAIISNIPDFDVFIARLVTSNPIDQMFFHRGIMHSIVFNIGLSLVIGYILYKSDKETPYRRYALACFCAILFGHLFIDGMTSYGMRYFLPRNKTVYSRDNMFVVDFGMWLITIGGFIWYHVSKYKKIIAQRIIGIVGAYIALSIGIQQYVKQQFIDSYPVELTQTTIEQSVTTVQPLQLALRRHIAKTQSGFYTAYYSIFDISPIERSFSSINQPDQSHVESLSKEHNKQGEQLSKVLNFMRGMYRINSIENGYNIENVLMGSIDGQSGNSNFGFQLIQSGTSYEINSSPRPRSINGSVRTDFWTRVWGK